eukprot:363771-Chlamydomonas_euryale.AAC.23
MRTCGSHVSLTRSSRYSDGNGPAYDMNADATTTSPGSCRSRDSRSVMDSSQRVRSPARPDTSFSARSSFPSRSASSLSSAPFFAMDPSYRSLSACTLASTSASCACAELSAACFFARLSCAA